MTFKTLIFCASALALATCGGANEAAVVENVVAHTKVGDIGSLMVNVIEITVSNPKSLKGLTAADFDLVNNAPDGFVDPATGGALKAYEDDGIVLTRNKNVLRIETKPFNISGLRGQMWRSEPWKLVCAADSNLNVTLDKVNDKRIAVLDDCIKGEFTYAGLTREYILHLPKDSKGNVIENAPLLVWQIGGGEYNRDLMTAVTANRCMTALPEAAVPCCAMDPIVPIHKATEKYDGQFMDDIEKAFQDKVYKWNGTDMVLADIDTKAFCALPMYFVHADSDTTCKVISSHAYYGARKRLGAVKDLIQIYDDAYMQEYGIPKMISHFSWVPLLNDHSEVTAMDWLIKQM